MMFLLELISSTMPVDDKLLHTLVDVTECDHFPHTTMESATLNKTTNTNNSEPESDAANLINFTTTEVLEKGAINIDEIEETEETDLKLSMPEDTCEEDISMVFPKELLENICIFSVSSSIVL